MIELLKSSGGIPAGPHLAAALISLLIKSSVVLIVAYAANILLRRANSVTRSLVLSITFVVLLVLPLLMIVVPSWPLLSMDIIPLPAIAPVAEIDGPGALAVHLMPDTNSSVSIIAVIVLLWIFGTSFLLIRFLAGWIMMTRITARARTFDDENIIPLMHRLRAETGLAGAVKLVFSEEVSSPQVFGLRHHRIILPEGAQNWPMQKLEMTLVHELAHVRRSDTLRYLIGSMAAMLYWFNPLVWICRRRLINESEMACDDFVLLRGSNAYSYAEILLGIARRVPGKRFEFAVTVNMTKKSELEDRLMSIMSNRNRRTTVKNSVFAMGLLLTLALVLPLSAAQLLAAGVEHDFDATDMYAQAEPSKDDGKIRLAAEKKQEGTTLDKDSAGNYRWVDEFVEVTTPAEMISGMEVTYPEEAEKQKAEGDVWVKALVDTTGTVKDVKIAKSSGYDVLDKAAMQSAYKCKFKPALNKDKTVAVWVSYKMTFALDDKVKK